MRSLAGIMVAVLTLSACAGGGAGVPESRQGDRGGKGGSPVSGVPEGESEGEEDSAPEDGVASAEGPNGNCSAGRQVRRETNGKIEAQATPDGIRAWALLWEEPPWPVGAEVKVVWRATGNGEFAVTAQGPGGAEVEPSHGPTLHQGSNWERPGSEWGTVFKLQQPGCWELRAEREDGSASIWIEVTQ